MGKNGNSNDVKKAASALGKLGGLKNTELTDKEKKQASKNAAIVGRLGGLKRGRAWEQMSEAERIASGRKTASAKKKKTPAEREAARKANSNRMRNYWKNLSSKKKREHLDRMKKSNAKRKRITAEDVDELRSGFESGEPQKRLAERFGISVQQVSNIVGYRSWKKKEKKEDEHAKAATG